MAESISSGFFQNNTIMSRGLRIIVIFFLASLSVQQSFAQGYAIEGIVKINNNTELPNVRVVLNDLQNSGSFQSTFSDSLGYYRFSNLKQGHYLVTAESQEHGRFVSDTIELNTENSKGVYDFLMESDAKALDEVVITNKKALIEAEQGKMIFNVAGNTANSGISAFEVLKKIPGITIGQNDDILLKGTSGANVMIDGKMSYITGNQLAIYLKGFSADDVSKIEVITNPSAAFDASGNSGLINIVTKANKKKGYALNLRSSISKGAFWMNNQNISGSMNQIKWNAYASFDYNTPHRKRTGESGNSIIENDQKITLSRETNIPFKIYYYTWKIGGSWKLAPNHKIGAHYHGYLDDFSGTKTSVVTKTTESGNLLSNVYSTYELIEPYHYDAYNFDYLFEIDSAGKKITADARYISYRNYSDALMTADHYGTAGESLFTNVIRTHQPGSIKIKSVQADAELLFDEINLKTGFKFAEVYNDNNFHSEKLDQDQYIEVEDMTDHFQYSEKIIAGYISASKSIGKISFDLGFRIEHTIS